MRIGVIEDRIKTWEENRYGTEGEKLDKKSPVMYKDYLLGFYEYLGRNQYLAVN